MALAEFPVPGMEGAESGDGGVSARDAPASDAATTDIDPAMVQRLDAVRALGKQAEAAGRPFEQMAVFSALITLCGECHRSLERNALPSPELGR